METSTDSDVTEPKMTSGKVQFMLKKMVVPAFLLINAFMQCAFAEQPKAADASSVERGRYLVKIGACNDCHTPGYSQTGGSVQEKKWLTGDDVGWRGPWGTTYAANLRLYMHKVSEEQWIMIARSVQFRPPMPWFNLHAMTEQDLRDIYRFVRYLGPAGHEARAYVPADRMPKGTYVQFPTQLK
jgi:mono/diheme cytochrome c family protein